MQEQEEMPMEEGYAYGGYAGKKKYQTGGGLDPVTIGPYKNYEEWTEPLEPIGYTPYQLPTTSTLNTGTGNIAPLTDNDYYDTPVGGYDPMTYGGFNKANKANKVSEAAAAKQAAEDALKIPFGTGDIVGMAGTAFGAIAPFFNTSANARAMRPNRNYYMGVGKEALDLNDRSQDLLADQLGEGLMDVDTAYNSETARNRGSASSVNTLRALDIASNVGRNKARGDLRSRFSNILAGEYGKRGDISMRSKIAEAQGQTMADELTTRDIDNLYTQRGANLANLSESIQGVGRNININRSNNINNKLLSQLSMYGLAFDKDGNLIDITPGKKTP